MKTYLVMPVGSIDLVNNRVTGSYCLLEVVPKPILAIISSSDSETREFYTIKNVLVHEVEDIKFRKFGDEYLWIFGYEKDRIEKYNNGIYKRFSEHYKLIEFPDDNTALLWFKLNGYG